MALLFKVLTVFNLSPQSSLSEELQSGQFSPQVLIAYTGVEVFFIYRGFSAEVKSNLPSYQHPQLLSLTKAAHLQGNAVALSCGERTVYIHSPQVSSVVSALPRPSPTTFTAASHPLYVHKSSLATVVGIHTLPWHWWCPKACLPRGEMPLWRGRGISFTEVLSVRQWCKMPDSSSAAGKYY